MRATRDYSCAQSHMVQGRMNTQAVIAILQDKRAEVLRHQETAIEFMMLAIKCGR